jgi:protein-arginine kinase
MQLLSLVRLGVVCGLLGRPDQAAVNQLLLSRSQRTSSARPGAELNQEQRRIARADFLRSRLIEK